jgi:hypothetical protein
MQHFLISSCMKFMQSIVSITIFMFLFVALIINENIFDHLHLTHVLPGGIGVVIESCEV